MFASAETSPAMSEALAAAFAASPPFHVFWVRAPAYCNAWTRAFCAGRVCFAAARGRAAPIPGS